MPIYKQTTEITNIDKVWANINKDIVEVYFGDKNVFTVWAELESPLPITILAAGEDLIDYRIYGNTESGESVGERTEQLFDISNAEANKYINVNTGEVINVSTGGYMLSDYIDVSDMDAVVMSSTVGANTSGSGGHLNLYDASKNWMRGISTYQASPANTKKVFLADVSNASYVRVDYAADFLLQNSLIEGSTAPTSYIPYGYQLPMVVRSRNLFDVSKAQSSYVSVEGDTIHKSSTAFFYDLNCFTTGAGANGNVDKMIPVKAGAYTVSCTSSSSSDLQIAIRYFDGVGQNYIHSAARLPYSFNVPNDGKISIRVSNDIALDIKGLKICPGSTAPTEYIPYYRDEENIYIGSDPLGEDEYVDYGEQKVYRRTEQLFNAETAAYKNGFFKNDDGFESRYPSAGYYETYIPITPSETIYVINVSGTENLTVRLYFYDAQKQWISRTIGYVGAFSVVTPSNAAYAQLQISSQFISSPNTITITQGSTVPSTYIPYLQPTDPPVPIPALPTIEGETIIDYNPSTTPAVDPEKMYVKYRKQGT